MVAVLIVLLLAVLLLAGGALGLRALRSLMEGRLGGIEDKLDRRLEGLDGRLLSTQQSSAEQASQLVERLTKLDGATQQMLARAGDLARLEQVLRPPKARGGFGELLLENLLRDRLPPTAWTSQHSFSNGERVDAVIRVEKLVPVDAKFPLDNFERMVEAESEVEQQRFAKEFARDVKGHIDAISSKYIRPAEGTYDFALMYLPVEAIYYELVSGKTGQLLTYAHDRRVFPVSPTTFTAYLQVIAFGLKGMEFEQHAHEVLAYCADLRKDFDRFKDDFELVGTHIGRAQSKFVEAEKRLHRFDGKLERAGEGEQPELEGEPELPRAIDAA
jgi:DNA recombination protein RmuC